MELDVTATYWRQFSEMVSKQSRASKRRLLAKAPRKPARLTRRSFYPAAQISPKRESDFPVIN